MVLPAVNVLKQENLRISQKQRDLQQLQEKLTSELTSRKPENKLAAPRFYQLILENI